MKHVRAAAFAVLLGLAAAPAVAENQAITLPLNDASVVRPHNVTVHAVRHNGSDALEVRLTGPYRGPDTDTFAFVPSVTRTTASPSKSSATGSGSPIGSP